MTRWIAAGIGFLYGAIYLVGVGDLTFDRGAGWFLQTGVVTLERITSMRSPFLFEGIALAEAGWWVILVSPLNLLLAGILGVLLAVNLHGAITLWREPRACGLSSAGSASGAVPALLAGSACCAPSLLLLLGMPSLGVLAAFFGYLIPVSIITLVASRVWQRRLGAPPFLAPAANTQRAGA